MHGQYAILCLLQVSLTACNGFRSISVICIVTRSVCRPQALSSDRPYSSTLPFIEIKTRSSYVTVAASVV